MILILAGGGGVPASVSNNAPTAVDLSNSSILDNAVETDVVGTITVTDADDTTLNSLTFSNSKFQVANISGKTAELQLSATGEGNITAGVDETGTFSVQDAHGNDYTSGTKTITIGDSAAETLLETVTLQNFSGASRTDPYVSFRRFFEAGDVPSGNFVEVRYSGSAVSLQQGDGLVLHGDGSLRAATFTCKPSPGAVADNGTFDLTLYSKSGSFATSSSISITSLTARDYKVRIKIGGTDYYCLLNNLQTAGTYSEIRVGNTIRGWRFHGPLRNGEGGSDTDHGALQAIFYGYVLSDGTRIVWCDVINGRVSAASALTIDEAELLDGASSLQLYTADFTFYAHNALSLCGADALPYWSSNATDIHANIDWLYLHDKNLALYTHSTSTQRAGITSGTALDYSPNAAGDIGDINAGGGSDWIGPVATWQALAILSNNKTRWRNDRVNALAQNVKHPGWYNNASTGYPPVLNNSDYTSDGLSAAQPSIGWSAAPTITDTGGSISGAALDNSHACTYAQLQAMTTGWEWMIDRVVTQAIGTLGGDNPGNDTYARNPTINSNTYYGAAFNRDTSREHAWAMRLWGVTAWTIPDAHPCATYVRDVNATSWSVVTQKMTAPYADAAWATLGIYPGGEGAASGIAVAPWMQNYRALMIMLAKQRGYITGAHKAMDHVEKWIIGLVNACPYHGAGFDRVAIRVGSQPASSAAYAEDFDDVWGGGDSGADPATGCSVKLISDSGGSSGACPSSGQDSNNEQYATTHTRPSIYHCVAAIASMQGITGASTALTALKAMETALAPAETAWNTQPQWRIRDPSNP